MDLTRTKAVLKANICVLVLLITFSQTSLAQEWTEPSQASIKQVTVFTSQAQVTKSAEVNVQKGITHLVFNQVSPFININSLQVKTDPNLNLISVSTKNNYLKSEQKPDDIIVLEDSIESTLNLLSHIKIKKEALQAERDLLLANKQLGGANTGLHADDLEEALALYHKRTEEIGEDNFKLSKSEKNLNLILAKLNAQLQIFQSKNQNPLELIITVESATNLSNAKIEFSYLAANASWSAFYDVRVKDSKSPLQLVSKANIIQSTGEDWTNVMLKLSTTDPNESGNKPELQTNFIGFIEPIMLESTMGRAKTASAPQMEDVTTLNYASAGIASIQQNAVNIEFNINNPYSIPSDNNPHQVDLTITNHNAIYSYAAVPKLDQSVFATARIPAVDLANQLPGEANVYYDGSFIGKSYIESTTKDTLIITLGKDKRIPIQRILLKEMSSKTCIGGTKKETNSWGININNTRKEPIEIIIEDQIPISRDKEIEVKLVDAGGAQFDEATGKLVWKLTIEPEHAIQFKFTFEVKYPKDKVINPY